MFFAGWNVRSAEWKSARDELPAMAAISWRAPFPRAVDRPRAAHARQRRAESERRNKERAKRFSDAAGTVHGVSRMVLSCNAFASPEVHRKTQFLGRICGAFGGRDRRIFQSSARNSSSKSRASRWESCRMTPCSSSSESRITRTPCFRKTGKSTITRSAPCFR